MARGGKREGAGRKPELARRLHRALIEAKAAEYEWALAYVADTMRNEDEPTPIRLMAAREVMDRIRGKPFQRTENIDVTRIALALLERGINPIDAMGDPTLRAFVEAMGVSPESLGHIPQLIDVEPVNNE